MKTARTFGKTIYRDTHREPNQQHFFWFINFLHSCTLYTQNGCLVFFMQTQKKLTRRIKKSIGNFSAWKESKNEREWRKKANTTNQTHNHKL